MYNIIFLFFSRRLHVALIIVFGMDVIEFNEQFESLLLGLKCSHVISPYLLKKII